MAKKEATPMELAVRYLARQSFSAATLTQRLRRAGVSESDAEAVVADCTRLGFVNDELYARDCVDMLASRGCGKLKIRNELKRRGVASEAPEAMSALPETELERAMDAASYKRRLLNRESDPRKLREKLWRFLISRGFTPDIIREAVRRTGEDTDAGDDDFL